MLKVEKNYKEYTAFFEENENGILTITVPALPGLVTEAKNMKDAKVILEDAIDCYVEGLKKIKREIPTENFFANMKLRVAV